ncbi:hypothetical protein I8J29_22000 [Paenibacillus sp. MWE-103]|uniref:YrhK-like protein n=1 Tax=Paenibacillus artemisiicola TaxID=1172618 RepID=A0ABS3WF02_9BACL|nr:hypothetical protein [Paenibacillus artemisiicola]MBO7746895.1 hypothetical protein [Paenibacillus artemisiicola]
MKSDLKDFEMDYSDKKENRVASLLIFAAWTSFGIGLLLFVLPWWKDAATGSFVSLCAFAAAGAFFRGMAEIIRLLHGIHLKMK